MRAIQNNIMVFCLFTIFLSGVTLATTEYSHLTNLFYLVPSIIILLIIYTHNKGRIIFYSHVIDLLYLSFFVFTFFSGIINTDLNNIMSSLKFLLIYMILILGPRTNPDLVNFSTINKSLHLLLVLVSILSILEGSFIFIRQSYRGIFGNPNSVGIFGTLFFTLSFYYFIKFCFYEKRIVKTFISLALMIVFLLVVILSSSRTAFVTIGAVILVVFLAYIVAVINSNKITMKQILITIGISFISGVLIYNIRDTQFYLLIKENIIEKFISLSGNLTSSRTVIWEAVLSESTYYGKEANYFSNVLGMSAHNSFIEIIGQYGWFSGTSYLLFWVFSFLLSLVRFVKFYRRESRTVFHLMFITVYITMSLTESLTHYAVAYIAIGAIGDMINSKVRGERNINP